MNKRSEQLTKRESADPFLDLSKEALHQLADQLLLDEPGVLEWCVEFMLAESRGYWHNRARAMLGRRLKHCRLDQSQRDRLVACIVGRLESGQFTEQFRDQLRLAWQLDANAVLEAVQRSSRSSRPHVRRYAEWVLSRNAHDEMAP